jgi:hypothetical protein
MVVIRFTWDVVGEDHRICSLDLSYSLIEWDHWSADERRDAFLIDAKRRCAENSTNVPDHLKFQILADLKQFAATYDWDTDRKVILSHT